MRIFNATGKLPIAGLQIRKFSRILYSRVWPAMAILGGITGLISLAMPWWLTNTIGVADLYFAYHIVRLGRLTSKYTLTRYPKLESKFAAAIIGGTYWAAMTGVEFALSYPQNPIDDITLLLSSLAAYVVVIGCIVRFPGTVEIRVSDLLPDVDSIPDNFMDSVRDGLNDVFKGRYRPQRPRPRHKKVRPGATGHPSAPRRSENEKAAQADKAPADLG
jgi:hypothetical protein